MQALRSVGNALGFTGYEDYSEEFKAKVFADIDSTVKKIAPREQAKEYLPLTDEWHVRLAAYTKWRNGEGTTKIESYDPPGKKVTVIAGDIEPVAKWPAFADFMAMEKRMEEREDALIAGDDAAAKEHENVIRERYDVSYRIARADELWRQRLSRNLSDEDVAWIMDDPSVQAELKSNMATLKGKGLMDGEVFKTRVEQKVRENCLETVDGTIRELIKDRETGSTVEWMNAKVSQYAEAEMAGLAWLVMRGDKVNDELMGEAIESAYKNIRKDPSVSEHLAENEPAYDMEGKPIGELSQEYAEQKAAEEAVPAADKEGRFEEFENAANRAAEEPAAAVVKEEAAKQEPAKFTPELWKIFVSDPEYGERGRKNAAEERKKIDAMPEGEEKKKAIERHEKKVATMEKHIAKAEAERKYAETLSKGQAEIAALEEQAKQKQAQYEQAKKDSAKALADNKAMLDAKYEAQKKENAIKIAALSASAVPAPPPMPPKAAAAKPPAEKAVVAAASVSSSSSAASSTSAVKFTREQQGQRLAAWNKNQKAQAEAKAQAWWASHPGAEEADKRQTANVVRNAADYDPSKNDFPGVDTKGAGLKAYKGGKKAAATQPVATSLFGGSKPVKFTREQQGQRLTAWNANERAQAEAKARAYWAQHPGSEIVDKQRTANLVRRAADYDPPRNDFAGVDTRAIGIKQGIVKFR